MQIHFNFFFLKKCFMNEILADNGLSDFSARTYFHKLAVWWVNNHSERRHIERISKLPCNFERRSRGTKKEETERVSEGTQSASSRNHIARHACTRASAAKHIASVPRMMHEREEARAHEAARGREHKKKRGRRRERETWPTRWHLLAFATFFATLPLPHLCKRRAMQLLATYVLESGFTGARNCGVSLNHTR